MHGLSNPAPALVLRDYQEAAVGALRGSYARGRRAPLFVLPTGGGKTVIFATIALGVSRKSRRALIGVHRRELVRQASAKLDWAGVPHGIIAAGFAAGPPDELVQVASIQTVARRLDHLPRYDLLIFDEAHHCRAETWRALIAAQPQAKLLGVTATPARLDGKGLGIAAGGPFDELVIGATTAELIAQGWLAPVRAFVPERRLDLRGVKVRLGDYVASDAAAVVGTATITGDAVEQYRRRADHQPAIAFCCTVAHAEQVAEAFRLAGYRAACVHGGTPTVERDALIGAITSATASCTACPRRNRSGRWREFEKRPGDAPVWECAACGCLNPWGSLVCAECGAERPCGSGSRARTEEAGELIELTAERLARVRRMSYWEATHSRLSEAELRAFARARGYHPLWVRHRLREQQEGAA